MSQLMLRFQRDIKSIAWASLGLFATLALISFNPSDPSFSSTGHKSAVQNFCGYFGSFLSDILYQLFGLSAWILVFVCFRLSWKIIRGDKIQFSKTQGALAILFIIISTSLVGLYFPQTKIFSGTVYLGGVTGLVTSQALKSIFNSIGVAVILWSAMLVLVMFYTEQTLKEGFEYFFKPLINILKKPRVIVSGAEEITKEILKVLPKIEPESESEKEAPRFVIHATTIDEKPSKKILEFKRRVENWDLPKLGMLESTNEIKFKVDERVIKRNTLILEDKLAQFGVNGKVVAVLPGPAVTMFEFKPNADVKISKITELADDLSLALSSESVRIIAPLPGRDVVGIETANNERDTVLLSDVLNDPAFWDEENKLPLALGKQANGETRVVDLRKMPHLLVAGTTGSGKSVFINSILTGLLFRHSPKTLKMILVDPKQVDLATFHRVPHLIMPPIKEPKKAVGGLRWAIREMEKRYRSMSRFSVRGLEGFNQKVATLDMSEVKQHQAFNEELAQTRRDTTEGYYFQELPYIIIVVEEFGDLMAVDKINVEQMVVRLAQMARACGIHLVLAMQSPRRDVVTGLIKTNIPGRISFKVASKMDSRIILDESGAERLLAQGDMLFLAPGVSKPQRHHGAWISEDEMQKVTIFWSTQGEPDFDATALKQIDGASANYESSSEENFEELSLEQEEKYDEILSYISGLKEVSASLLQRKFRLGYPRAARVIEIFEKEGVVGPANGSKPRPVLINKL